MKSQLSSIPRLTFSLDESAIALGLSRRLLYSLIDRRELKTVKIGRRRLVPAAELERLVEVGA